jgi:uncharacterized membrane protein YjfL (UPF0719 family)
LWAQFGWMLVAVIIVICVYSIVRMLLRDRDRQIEVSLKVVGIVDGKLVIKKVRGRSDSLPAAVQKCVSTRSA